MSFSSVLTGIADRISGVYTKYNSAIILAGGSSTRIGGSKTKQLVPILGVPTVVRTVSVFEKCKSLVMSDLHFYFGKLCVFVENFLFQKTCTFHK